MTEVLPPARNTNRRPTKQDILEFINESPTPVDKREIARAFRIRGDDRIWLKAVLKELQLDGTVIKDRSRKLTNVGRLPEVAVIEVSRIGVNGEVVCRPTKWRGNNAPLIYLKTKADQKSLVGKGDHILAKLQPSDNNTYKANAIKLFRTAPSQILGIFEQLRNGGVIRPTDRRIHTQYSVTTSNRGNAKSGELVKAERINDKNLRPQVKVVERLGSIYDTRTFSLIAIHTHGIPDAFGEEVLIEAAKARPITLEGRTDFRELPLVTIDGGNARDFDDAVWAAPDREKCNPGGWHIIVAIADVTWYVRAGGALDLAAHERGNSVYFPDRVVPMLPESISNDLCSLRPNEDRACLAVNMWITANGALKRYKFERGIMRSVARLTYEQVERARNGMLDNTTRSLPKDIIEPLYGAYSSFMKMRTSRGALDLDLPETEVIIGTDGTIKRVQPSLRLESHRVIEEFMIAANVAAAETLESNGYPVMYRIHDTPPPQKIESLRQSLKAIGFSLAKGIITDPRSFHSMLRKAEDTENFRLVSELILRSQAKASYHPLNVGHFGLALKSYCHFTSPIRRYSDIIVHRGLISALKLGEGGFVGDEQKRFEEIGEHISATERRAVSAERDVLDRFAVAFVADRKGAIFPARISSATRFGLFVTLDKTNTDGLVPISTLPYDYYIHDDVKNCLIGENTGITFHFGDRITVCLEEANLVTGGLIFSVVEDNTFGNKRTTVGPKPGDKSHFKLKAVHHRRKKLGRRRARK